MLSDGYSCEMNIHLQTRMTKV